MDTKGSNVGASFTTNPEYGKVSVIIKFVKLALMNSPDAELTFNSRNQRWALEKCTGQCLEGTGKLRLATWNLVVEANHAYILLSSALLGLDKSSGTVDTDD
jgi:hypothetical protein